MLVGVVLHIKAQTVGPVALAIKIFTKPVLIFTILVVAVVVHQVVQAQALVVAVAAVYLYLRGRRSCSIQGARHYWRLLMALVVAGGVTYASLFWFTKYLGIWFA